jgi:hypothetical protein
MAHETIKSTDQVLKFAGTDLEVRVSLANASLTIDVIKSGACVHRVVLDHATDPIENAWLAELFAREERVPMDELAHQLDDYVAGLNPNQG